jgi:hypothetical protein
VIGQAFQVDGVGVDVPIAFRRSNALEEGAHLLALQIGTEPIEPDPGYPRRRAQMRQLRNDLQLLLVVLQVLVRKSVEYVPLRANPEDAEPPQGVDVLERGDPLLHETKSSRVETLDPGLNATNPGLREHGCVSRSYVRLDLIEQIRRGLECRQGRQKVASSVGCDDVVRRVEPVHTVCFSKHVDFFAHSPCRLGPECHSHRIETAERAVMFGAPPTSTRRLVRNCDGVAELANVQIDGPHRREVRPVIRYREAIHFAFENGIPIGCPFRARQDPLTRAGVAAVQ